MPPPDVPTVEHLKLIQAVVTRLASNSFAFKNWAVALASASIALGATNSDAAPLIGLFPTAVFWALDGYYLRQERLFRRLYDRVRRDPDELEPFSMDTSVVAGEVASWWGICRSRTIWPLYALLALTVVAAAVLFTLAGQDSSA